MIFIGIGGERDHGKDSAATWLNNYYLNQDLHCKMYNFADPLKEGLKAFYGFGEEQLYSRKDEIDPYWGITPRHAMEIFGSEIMQYEIHKLMKKHYSGYRDYGRRHWILRLEKSLKELKKFDVIIIESVRFFHEIDFMRNNNALLMKVIRTNVPSLKLQHDSQTELLDYTGWDCSFVAENIQDLHLQLKKHFDSLDIEKYSSKVKNIL